MTGDQASRLTRAEIISQPDCWRQALKLAAAGITGVPATGERVLVLGCGTSHYVGSAYAWLREAAGEGYTDALIASELPPHLRSYDRVVAISRSGTSSELLDAVRRVRAEQPVVAVTALLGQQNTPLAELATTVVDLSFADEVSVVQTRFPTTQLMMLRATLANADPHYLASLPQAAEVALLGRLPDPKIRQLVVLGHEWGTAIGQEAALKVRESAGAWVESYAVGEYRHGPIATSGPGTLVWGLDRLPADLAKAVVATGGTVENGCGEPLIELVRLHRFAVDLATANGRDADTPRYLSRSVILEQSAVETR